MTIFERIMAVLTLAGVVIAVFTGLIFWKQLKEMRTDQRAWVSMASGSGKFAKEADGNTIVTVPMTITNTGKTPAKAVFNEIVVEKVKNGDSPEFIYDNRARTYNSTGTIFPNGTQQVTAGLLKGKLNTNQTEPLLLTPSQVQDLTDGTYYLAIYSQTSYFDVFGTKHWLHFCAFATLSPVPIPLTAKKCTDYNDVDND